jgi:class 3 adenylate cyclase
MKYLLTFLLILLISIGSGKLHAQSESSDMVDSLKTELQKIKTKNSKAASLYVELGMAYYVQKDYPNAKQNFKEAYDYYQGVGDKKGIYWVSEWNKQIEIKQADEDRATYQNMIIVGIIVVLIGVILVMVWEHKKQKSANAQLSVEKKKSEELILNILPEQVAKELKEKGMSFANQYDPVTVILTDFVSFTTVGEKFSPNQLVGELNACFKAFDDMLDKYHIEKIKTVGDAYLCVAGLPGKNKNHAIDAVNFAIHMRDFMLRRRNQLGEATFQMRIGVHTGGVIAGIVGTRKYAYDIWGDTVNTAARMEQNSEPGKINISHSTYELVKDKFACNYRGEIEAKRKGKLQMYFVEDPL